MVFKASLTDMTTKLLGSKLKNCRYSLSSVCIRRILRWLLGVWLCVSFSSFAQDGRVEDQKIIKFAVYIGDGRHRAFVLKILKQYQDQHPNIKIELQSHRDNSGYPLRVRGWLTNQSGPDVIYWYMGRRTSQYSDLGLLHDLNDFWTDEQLDRFFPREIVGKVRDGEHIYALPVTSFLWSMYYNESSMKRLGVLPPKTWDDVLAACKTLRKQGVDLFALGTKTQWVTHGWFDYIMLRTQGLSFYQRLVDGQVEYTDPRVRQALEYWKQLIDLQCFNDNHAAYSVWSVFPRIFHGLSVITMSDGVPQGVSPGAQNEIRLMPFPVINPDIPQYTVAPLNGFIVPKYTEVTDELKSFLRFLMSEEFQHDFNIPIQRVPSRIVSARRVERLTLEASKVLVQSPGGVLFFDRDTDIRMADYTPQVFVDFHEHADVDRTLRELEALRLKVFGLLSPTVPEVAR